MSCSRSSGSTSGAIRDILVGEDALAGLRREYHQGPEAARRREILIEASAINEKLRTVVTDRQELLRTMMDSLEDKSARYAGLLAELDADPATPTGSVRSRGRGRTGGEQHGPGPAGGAVGVMTRRARSGEPSADRPGAASR